MTVEESLTEINRKICQRCEENVTHCASCNFCIQCLTMPIEEFNKPPHKKGQENVSEHKTN